MAVSPAVSASTQTLFHHPLKLSPQIQPFSHRFRPGHGLFPLDLNVQTNPIAVPESLKSYHNYTSLVKELKGLESRLVNFCLKTISIKLAKSILK